MKAKARVPLRLHFDDAAQLPAIFGGETRGQNAHFLHIVDIEIGNVGNRPVVSQRKAVEHILNLILLRRG